METLQKIIIGVIFGILAIIIILFFGGYLGEDLYNIILGWIFG